MTFNEFANTWHKETFLQGAFGGEMDFEECLDDPEFGVGDPSFDSYSDEINDFLFPTL